MELPAFTNLGHGGNIAPRAAPRLNLHTVQDIQADRVRNSDDLTLSERDERDLIEKAKRDPEAFAVLYRTHFDAVAGYIHRRVGDAHATDDLVADVFLTAMRSLPRFRYRGIPIRAWFYRLATNSVNRWARRQRYRKHATLTESQIEDVATYAAPATERIDRDRARVALLSLKPKYQTVLALHYLEGLSLEDVATATGWRIGTVKSRLSRARDALRARLSQGR